MKAYPIRLTTGFLFVTILFLAAHLTILGQTWTQYDQGTPPLHAAGVSPLGSYMSTDLGNISLNNGALNINLPLGTVGGRGFNIPLSLNYSSKVWSIAHDEAYDPIHHTDFNMAYTRYGAADSFQDLFNRVAVGWIVSGTPLLKSQTVGLSPCGNGYYAYVLTKLTVVLPDKGEVELRDDLSDGAPLYAGCSSSQYRGRRWHATDGSGMIFLSDNDNGVVNGDLLGTLITRDGLRFRFTSVSPLLGRLAVITDANGNQITITAPQTQSRQVTSPQST